MNIIIIGGGGNISLLNTMVNVLTRQFGSTLAVAALNVAELLREELAYTRQELAIAAYFLFAGTLVGESEKTDRRNRSELSPQKGNRRRVLKGHMS